VGTMSPLEGNPRPSRAGRKSVEISDMDSLTFSVESSIHLDDFKNLLESNNWEKVLDEGESEWYGNFRVVYKKGTYEITLFCDVDGYVFKFEITITKENK